MIRPSFESFSRNAEDVVLWRALQNVERGRYVDVGAGHPSRGSVSMAFYLHGWSGIAVEPDPRHIPLLTEQRPRDIVIGSAITAKDGDVATLHVFEGADRATLDPDVALVHAGSGLEGRRIEVPTRRLDQVLDGAGWQGLDLHFLAVDAEGSERDVLSSIDLETWRPWVLVVHALQPDWTASNRASWEHIVLEAGYRLCLFDGVCCFYVSEERGGQLAGFLDHGACALDDYTTPATRQAAEAAGSLPALEEDLRRWRTEVIGRWARVMAEKDELARLRLALGEFRTRYQTLAREHHELSQESHSLYLQMRELRRSASWRITQPLRSAGGLLQRDGAGR